MYAQVETSFGQNVSYPICETINGNGTVEITQGDMWKQLNKTGGEARVELLQCEANCRPPCIDVEYETTFR